MYSLRLSLPALLFDHEHAVAVLWNRRVKHPLRLGLTAPVVGHVFIDGQREGLRGFFEHACHQSFLL